MTERSLLTILVAEDDPAQLFVLELFLKKWGYDVVSAENGLEALCLLRQSNAPRFAILDWQMPGMEGIEICNRLRMDKGSENDRSQLYILMLSAKTQAKDIRRALDAGANDYLTKPYDPQELHQKIQSGFRFLKSYAQAELAETSQLSAYP
ncbi:MAG: hypothetical protein A3F68_09285 [Acidobacteria bacterium RIFCSPLOWO2_12_FULL_54_10]|nr:MAG: hypothetical protein A3F68_09285 [Acidobacteria bacterium RIFCSPLOWO2_12_FULL_54_10]